MNKEDAPKKEAGITYQEKLIEMEKALQTGYEGVITDITEMTNFEYFKVKGSYGEKDGIQITVLLNSPEKETFTQWYSVPDKTRGLEQSNMYRFKQKYGDYPKKSIPVSVFIDENGFYKIQI